MRQLRNTSTKCEKPLCHRTGSSSILLLRIAHPWIKSKGKIMMKGVLLVSVSSVALAASAPAVMAADLAPRAFVTKAPFLEPSSTWWIEGGLQTLSGGDTAIAGFNNPGFVTPATTSGWNIAGGVDYRLDAWWHVSAAYRYGRNKSRTTNGAPIAVFGVPTTPAATSIIPLAFAGSNSASHEETNWVADFMVGRDIGLGLGKSQVKFGVRVAEIRGKTNGSASFQVPTAATSTPAFITHTRSYQQTNRFLGAGPRLAIEGSAPIGGAWSVDYMGGVAALYGHQSVNQTVTVANIGGVANCLAGCPINFGSIDDGFIFNTDAMLGLGYAFTPYAKLSLNYRVDAYFNALRVIDANNNVDNVNRVYHGPNLRLTVNY